MFKVEGNVIKLTRGDYACFDIKITDFEGEPYIPADNETVTFTVKRNTRTDEILIQKTGTNIQILGADTENLNYGHYFYDVQLTYENGERDTFITPTDFIITDEVTW